MTARGRAGSAGIPAPLLTPTSAHECDNDAGEGERRKTSERRPGFPACTETEGADCDVGCGARHDADRGAERVVAGAHRGESGEVVDRGERQHGHETNADDGDEAAPARQSIEPFDAGAGVALDRLASELAREHEGGRGAEQCAEVDPEQRLPEAEGETRRDRENVLRRRGQGDRRVGEDQDDAADHAEIVDESPHLSDGGQRDEDPHQNGDRSEHSESDRARQRRRTARSLGSGGGVGVGRFAHPASL